MTDRDSSPLDRTFGGPLRGGGEWLLEVPEAFSGTVCLYSAGYGGSSDPRPNVAGGDETRRVLLERGYAVAGSRTVSGGWIVGDALVDQAETVEAVRETLGDDIRIIAWGHSMGGLITAGLAERAPGLIDGAVPFCASVAGAVPMLNQGLDAAFALKTLCFADERLDLVDVTSDDRARLEEGRVLIERARRTPVGRARVALAAALAQIPTWTVDNMFSSGDAGPEPSTDDIEALLKNQASVLPYVAFSPRVDLERRAGGNFSWNTGVDYAEQLRLSGFADLVAEAYRRADADLDADLAALARAARISADDGPVAFMERNLTPVGEIGVPVLTVAITGDFAPTLSQSAAYADVVAESGRSDLLQRSYIHAPGHCGALSAAEIVAGIDTMDARLSSGEAPDASATAMNVRASDIARAHHVDPAHPPAFVDIEPPPHVRPHPHSARRAAPSTAITDTTTRGDVR